MFTHPLLVDSFLYYVCVFLPLLFLSQLYLNYTRFLCLPGNLPADVDLQTGVRRGRKAVCGQEVPLICDTKPPSHHNPRHCLCHKLNIMSRSPLTLDSGTLINDRSCFV